MTSDALKALEAEMDLYPYPSSRLGEVNILGTKVSADALKSLRKEWQGVQAEILDRWKEQCLADNGLSTHPKAVEIMDFAWEQGHPAGLYEVESWVQRLSELIGTVLGGDELRIKLFIRSNEALNQEIQRLNRNLEDLTKAAEELIEVGDLRGDTQLPHPDPLL